MPALKLKLDPRRLARLLALSMTVADLSGRAKVIAAVLERAGLKVRPELGPALPAGGAGVLVGVAAARVERVA